MNNHRPVAAAWPFKGLHAPEVLTIAITDQCNLSCLHCWVDADEAPHRTVVQTSDLITVINTFADIGGKGIRVTGGEPLLHPDFSRIVRHISSLGLDVHLQTNATIHGPILIETLNQTANIDAQISLDGATEKTHDALRGPGTFARTVSCLEKIKHAGLSDRISLFFTEMQHNLHELPELFTLAEQLGITTVSSGTIVVCGRAKAQKNVCQASAEQYRRLLERYQNDSCFKRRYDRYGNTAIIEWYKHGLKPHRCAFIKNPYLSATGTLYPCLLGHITPYAVTETYQKGLLEALHEGSAKWIRLQQMSDKDEVMSEACQSCSLLPVCGGGCLGRAWANTGTFPALEDRCSQRKIVLKLKK